MSKQITLPYGLSAADVDVGTLALVSGRTYNVTNITTQAVEDAMGVTGTNGVKVLCTKSTTTKPGLNPWAAFKPTGNVKPHGMVVNTSTNDIEYDAPTDADGYRLGDFAGYHNKAPKPAVLGVSTVYFTTTGYKDFMVLLKLPEVDLRDIHNSITHVAAKVYTGAGYTTLENTYTEEIDNAWVETGGISIDCQVNCSSLANKNYRVVIELGYLNTRSEFVKYCNWPKAALTGGEVYYDKTAYYVAAKTLTFPQILEHSYITPTPESTDVYLIYYQNVTLNAATLAYSFEYKITKLPYADEDEENITGTCDVYMKNPQLGTWHQQKNNITLPSSGYATVSGTLSGITSGNITDNIEVEFRDVQES